MANMVMAYTVMAYVATAYIVIAYVVAAYIIMAYIVMAYTCSSRYLTMWIWLRIAARCSGVMPAVWRIDTNMHVVAYHGTVQYGAMVADRGLQLNIVMAYIVMAYIRGQDQGWGPFPTTNLESQTPRRASPATNANKTPNQTKIQTHSTPNHKPHVALCALHAPQMRQKNPKPNTIENHFSPQTQSQNPRRAWRATNATKTQTKIKNVDVLTEPCLLMCNAFLFRSASTQRWFLIYFGFLPIRGAWCHRRSARG